MAFLAAALQCRSEGFWNLPVLPNSLPLTIALAVFCCVTRLEKVVLLTLFADNQFLYVSGCDGFGSLLFHRLVQSEGHRFAVTAFAMNQTIYRISAAGQPTSMMLADRRRQRREGALRCNELPESPATP